ncbi:MAG: DUF2797 domain-containing protein [Bacteriovorax sp.]|nr:DUF2797 domain-containing protein [Bacteriovorax sp.]
MNTFNLDKMRTDLVGGLAHYHLGPKENGLHLNALVGKMLKFHFKNEIHCTHCDKLTKKSYSGGYCYPCSLKLAECDMCILKPELCHYALGTCREPSWGDVNCMIDHYVYLANSSGLKVGITRSTQIPTRWMDQGAVAGLPILKVSSRLQSGIFEKLFASELNDKTDWRKMLKGQVEEIDLLEKREEVFELFGDEIDRLESDLGPGEISILENEQVTEISYPVFTYPEKVTSMSFDKSETIGGILQGIKGQYLIFDTGVINIRSHTGYKIECEYEE